MKKRRLFLVGVYFLSSIGYSLAQCSICTKTAQQMGEGPASALNNAIVYLMMMPLLIMGFVGFKWWKKEKEVMAAERGEKK